MPRHQHTPARVASRWPAAAAREDQAVIAAVKDRARATIRCDVCGYLLRTRCTCPGGPRGDAA